MSLTKNLFTNLPSSLSEELVTVLAGNRHVRIERIVSSGQTSAKDFWYEQHEHEWIIVLRGEAMLFFEDDGKPVAMKAGDHVLIPALRRHRVDWTTPDEPTVWLAVFYSDA